MTPEKIKKLRNELGWTQERLARETDCSRGYICNIEKGREDITKAFIDKVFLSIRNHLKIIRKMIK